jgi:luciferase family oxidoreductase group 1
MKYSVLDLATIVKGDSIQQTFSKSVTAAQHVESLGYTRYWFSEHHNFPNVASAATTILMGHIASQTQSIRIGSGGIMLPNHTTLSVAEQFGTLDGLYPGRIDMGLGRAPGTDMQTAAVLRRGQLQHNYDFEAHIAELRQYMSVANSNAAIRAIPGEGANVPIYILGSSTDSAFLAAKLGLPYAFAAHFAPGQLEIAMKIYEEQFIPSKECTAPYKMICINIIGAETEEKAHLLSLSHFQAFINILTDNRSPLLPPEETNLDNLPQELLVHLNRMAARTFIGDETSLKEQLATFVNTVKPDEIIVSGNIYDFEAKLQSYTLAAGILHNL